MDRHGLICRTILEQPDVTQRELARMIPKHDRITVTGRYGFCRLIFCHEAGVPYP